jgi:hypothetical protein
MRELFLIVVFSLAGSAALCAEPAAPRPAARPETADAGLPRVRSWRRHFVLKTSRQDILYYGTEIIFLSHARSESTLLLWDQGAGRGLKLHNVTDFEAQETTYRVEETEGNAFLSMSFPLGFAARTLQETLKQGRENPLLYETIDPPTTFATNSYRRTALESQWRDAANLRMWRSEIRLSMAATLLEQLERLRDGAIAAPPLDGYAEIVLKPIFYGSIDAESLTEETAPADCRFDAEMDHPCSDAQRQRVKEAEKAGQVLRNY